MGGDVQPHRRCVLIHTGNALVAGIVRRFCLSSMERFAAKRVIIDGEAGLIDPEPSLVVVRQRRCLRAGYWIQNAGAAGALKERQHRGAAWHEVAFGVWRDMGERFIQGARRKHSHLAHVFIRKLGDDMNAKAFGLG